MYFHSNSKFLPTKNGFRYLNDIVFIGDLQKYVMLNDGIC